jgi:Protein of unknown function (DUF1559)
MKRAALLIACLCALVSAAGEPAQQAKSPKAWSLDEAMSQLKLYPKDSYLQYVVLQLARRDNRLAEVSAELDRLLGAQAWQARNERAQSVDLFNIFSGALAIQESLQLDTMRGASPKRATKMMPAPSRPVDAKSGSPKAAPPPPAPQRDAPVRVASLSGPTIKSHPWQQMLAGKKPEISPLARCVPEEFYFVEFRSLTKMLEALDLSDQWGSHLFSQAVQEARTQLIGERLKQQLAVETEPILRPFYDLVVEEAAVTGSDLFVREGSDLTILFRFKQPAVFKTRMNGFLDNAMKARPDARHSEGNCQGVPYVHVATPDRAIHVYSAYPQENLHVRSNSLVGLTRVLEAIQGKATDGHPVRRLGDTDEFAYIRTLLPRGAAEEDGFVYLSDPFIRQLVGPQVKLTERRRMLCYNHLRMIGHAALLYRTEHGKPPASLAELAQTGCAPGIFGQGELTCPDSGAYSLSANGLTGACSHHGHAECLTPCCEIPLNQVKSEEAEEYKAFLQEYNQYWRTYFDPIALRMQITPKRLRLETIVLPLIDNSVYTGLAMALGGKPEALDALPVPRRNIFSVALRLRKDELLEQSGLAEAPAAETAKGASSTSMRDRVACSNNLKQLVLAMANYESVHTKLPAVANFDKQNKPLLSWRVHLLPYLDQAELYEKFHLNEPWDSEHNKKLIPRMPALFRCPGSKTTVPGLTTYLVPVGKETMFTGDNKQLRITDAVDGTSNTILIVDADDEHAVTWTKPQDLTYDSKNPWTGLVGHHQDSFQTVFVDGSGHWFGKNLARETLQALFTRAGGEVVNILPGDELGLQPRQGFFLDAFGLGSQQFEQLRYQEFLTKGIGNQVGLHVYDAVPLIDLNLPSFLGMAVGSFSGRRTFGGGEEGLAIGFVGASLTSPVYVSIPVRDAKIVDSFLERLDPILAGFSRNQDRGFIPVNQDFCKTSTAKGVTVRSYAVIFGPVKWRLFWARVGTGLYLTNKQFILDDLLEMEGKTDAVVDKGPIAHGMLRMRPENWNQVLPDYRLGWAENNRESCINNVGPLSSLARALPSAGGQAATLEHELDDLARKLYGVHFYCPDGGHYVVAPDGKSVSCNVHGSALAPRQPPAQNETSAPNKLLRDFAGMTVSLTFLEDGLHAVVTIERK